MNDKECLSVSVTYIPHAQWFRCDNCQIDEINQWWIYCACCGKRIDWDYSLNKINL